MQTEINRWPNYFHWQRPEILEGELLALVSITDQTMCLLRYRKKAQIDEEGCFFISTGKNGFGNQSGSGQTPIGWHQIRAKIGENCPDNSVFVGRRPTGERYTEKLARMQPDRDWILTRILWLSGCQTGFNRLRDCDSMRRYIYIHGTPETEPMGVAKSHGCIRMRNPELIQTFESMAIGSKVFISEQSMKPIKEKFLELLS